MNAIPKEFFFGSNDSGPFVVAHSRSGPDFSRAKPWLEKAREPSCAWADHE